MTNEQDHTEKDQTICKSELVDYSGLTKLAKRTSGREQTKFK